jgi:uncharacterized protein (TIGR00369 family)
MPRQFSNAFRRVTSAGTMAAWEHLFSRDAYALHILEAVGCNPLKQSLCTEDGQLMVFPMIVLQESTNVFSTLHGGALLSLVDVLTSLHYDHVTQPRVEHVTSHLNTQFLKAVPLGQELAAVTSVRRQGRTTFMHVEFMPPNSYAIPPGTVASADAFATGAATKVLLPSR